MTALQLATAYATLANDGVRMQPRIVRKITDLYGDVLRLPAARRRASVRAARDRAR